MIIRGNVIKTCFAREKELSWGPDAGEDLQHQNWQVPVVSVLLSLRYLTVGNSITHRSCLVSIGNGLGLSCNEALLKNLGFVVFVSQTGGSHPDGSKSVSPRISVTRFITACGYGWWAFALACQDIAHNFPTVVTQHVLIDQLYFTQKLVKNTS